MFDILRVSELNVSQRSPRQQRMSSSRRGRREAFRRAVAFESLERRDLLSGQPDLGLAGTLGAGASELLLAGEGEGEPVYVQYSLSLLDASGKALPKDANGRPTVAEGQTFRLYGLAKDMRPGAAGVFAAYLDVFYTNEQLVDIRYGETQRLEFLWGQSSQVISGNFKLTFDGRETASIPYGWGGDCEDYVGDGDCFAVKIQSALEQLPNVGPGNVLVTVEPTDPNETPIGNAFRVQFLKALGERDVPTIGINATGLVNCVGATATELYPADATNANTFRTAFTGITPYINGVRGWDRDPEAGETVGGKSFAAAGSFTGQFTATNPAATKPFFYVQLKAVGPGLVEFSGNPSNTGEDLYKETDTLVYPLNSSDQNFVVEAVNQGFTQTVASPLVLSILPRNVFTVNSTADTADANPGNGICADAGGACTLRAAIQETNALPNLSGGPDLIEFQIPGPGPYTIQPTSTLPTITGAVVLDATTQAGYAGTPVVQLSGNLAGAGVSGLQLGAGGNTIKGLAINRFAASGIVVLTGSGNTIQGNFLGTDLAGTVAAANAANGLDVRTSGNTIGGAGTSQGNLISGNTQFGILLSGSAASNVVFGNRIGTNQAGTAAIANGLYGIYVTSANNQIGGAVTGEGNVISGNTRGGVAVTGAMATGNRVRGNRVGTKADGASALANGNAGITVSNAPGNTIGGTAAGAGNVLSGNTLHGAMIVGAATINTLVQGNLVGLNAAGTAAVPNGQYGITNYAPNNLLGGSDAGAGNTVSGNNYSGVLVYTPTATGVRVQGNRIGTNAAGTAAVPNGFYGVYVNSTDNFIGGTAAGEGNQISGNTRGGVALTEKTAKRNAVQGNRIGTDPAGTAAVPNIGSGVTISEGSDNTIGGTAAGAGNQISGNGAQGVIVVGVNATGNAVHGNLIGLNAAGTAALPNGQYGVAVYSSNTTIGTAGSGNTISGNTSGGVIAYGASLTGTKIQGNRIGTDVTGAAAVPNGGQGVYLLATNSLVGGAGAGQGNTIARNTGSGVYVVGAASVRNAIRQNSISKNGLWGIDVAPYGATANDADDPDTGTNNGQNFPVVTAAVLNGATLNISYSVPSTTGNSAYPLAVEFFLADADNQEGQTYLGGESYAAPGADSVALSVSGVTAGKRLVATATDANGNSSEFSASFVVTSALQAAAVADGGGSPATVLDAALLEPVLGQAIAVWAAAGLDTSRVAVLNSVAFEIADLPDRYLGWASPDRIVLDNDAAGYGWYVDGDSDSGSPLSALDSRLSIDLLTVVVHEMGHVLGLADTDAADELMGDVLQHGTRLLPTAADIDRILAGGDW